MDRIWAPWRVKYITEDIHKKKTCVFCTILEGKRDEKHFIFSRSTHCFAVLNLYPYNNGHALVLPYRHVDGLAKLRPEERADLWDLVLHCQSLLEEVLAPQGYNIGMNLGKVAGAGFPGHVHVHIVPRWNGDVNFMPIIGDTRVISQSLQALYGKLRQTDSQRRAPQTLTKKKRKNRRGERS